MKIDTGYIYSPNDYLIQIDERLEVIKSELECPEFMLGCMYRLALRSELVRLVRRKKIYEIMVKESYE